MERLSCAKKEYMNIEIPSELSSVVEEAIKKSEQKNTYKINVFKKILPAVSICAMLCLVIGIGGLWTWDGDEVITEGDSEPMIVSENSRMMPASGAKTEAVYDMSQPEINEAVSERIVKESEKGNTLDPVFIGEKYASFMCVDENGYVKYFNFNAKDGSDVSAEDLGIRRNEKFDFYISSENSAVLVFDGYAEEVVFG